MSDRRRDGGGSKGGAKEKPLTFKQKASIKFVEQEEPAFIRAIKKSIGFREPAKLEDKVSLFTVIYPQPQINTGELFSSRRRAPPLSSRTATTFATCGMRRGRRLSSPTPART